MISNIIVKDGDTLVVQDNNDNRKTELQDIIAKLEQGVKDVFNSGNYINYLSKIKIS